MVSSWCRTMRLFAKNNHKKCEKLKDDVCTYYNGKYCTTCAVWYENSKIRLNDYFLPNRSLCPCCKLKLRANPRSRGFVRRINLKRIEI